MAEADSDLRNIFTKSGFPVPDLEEIEIFHERTKFFPANAAALGAQMADYVSSELGIAERTSNRLRFPLARRVSLPRCPLAHVQLGDAFRARRSCREFRAESIPVSTLSCILSALQVVRTGTVDTGKDMSLAQFHSRHMRNVERDSRSLAIGYRPYPSAGALYPIETYVLTLRVQDLEPSIWHYDPWCHELELVLREVDEEQLCAAMGSGRHYVKTSSILILHTALFERSAVKYGFRSYRFCLQEVGAMAMCVSLAATAAGVGDLQIGGIFDDLANDLLGADGVSETILGGTFCGVPRTDVTAPEGVESALDSA